MEDLFTKNQDVKTYLKMRDIFMEFIPHTHQDEGIKIYDPAVMDGNNETRNRPDLEISNVHAHKSKLDTENHAGCITDNTCDSKVNSVQSSASD